MADPASRVRDCDRAVRPGSYPTAERSVKAAPGEPMPFVTLRWRRSSPPRNAPSKKTSRPISSDGSFGTVNCPTSAATQQQSRRTLFRRVAFDIDVECLLAGFHGQFQTAVDHV